MLNIILFSGLVVQPLQKSIFSHQLVQQKGYLPVLSTAEKCHNQSVAKSLIIPSPTKLRRDIVTLPSVLPSVRPSFHNILVNTLETTSFNGFCLNLVHTQSLGESGTLLIFMVKGQCHQVKFLPRNILVNTLESTSFNGF